jgi:hypothetical protein
VSNRPLDKGKAKVGLRSSSRSTPGRVGVRGDWDCETPGQVRCRIRKSSVGLCRDKGKVHLGQDQVRFGLGLTGVSSWVPSG